MDFKNLAVDFWKWHFSLETAMEQMALLVEWSILLFMTKGQPQSKFLMVDFDCLHHWWTFDMANKHSCSPLYIIKSWKFQKSARECKQDKEQVP